MFQVARFFTLTIRYLYFIFNSDAEGILDRNKRYFTTMTDFYCHRWPNTLKGRQLLLLAA